MMEGRAECGRVGRGCQDASVTCFHFTEYGGRLYDLMHSWKKRGCRKLAARGIPSPRIFLLEGCGITPGRRRLGCVTRSSSRSRNLDVNDKLWPALPALSSWEPGEAVVAIPLSVPGERKAENCLRILNGFEEDASAEIVGSELEGHGMRTSESVAEMWSRLSSWAIGVGRARPASIA